MGVKIYIVVFWLMTLRSLVEVYQIFRGLYCLTLQGQRRKQQAPLKHLCPSMQQPKTTLRIKYTIFHAMHGLYVMHFAYLTY
jgi:hypothetical protein